MEPFFERPILNSPYAFPARHWELDKDGQPTNQIIENRRRSDLITPVPKPKKRRQTAALHPGVGSRTTSLLSLRLFPTLRFDQT